MNDNHNIKKGRTYKKKTRIKHRFKLKKRINTDIVAMKIHWGATAGSSSRVCIFARWFHIGFDIKEW